MTTRKKPTSSKPAPSKSTRKDETAPMSDRELDEVSGGLVGSDGGFSDLTTSPLVSTEVVSPRDPASGLPTGKRTYKPL